MRMTTFKEASEARDDILASPRAHTIRGLTIAERNNYNNASPDNLRPTFTHLRTAYDLVLDFNDGYTQTITTTEDLALFLEEDQPIAI